MRASATDIHLFTEPYPDAELPRLPMSEGWAVTYRQNGRGTAGNQQVPPCPAGPPAARPRTPSQRGSGQGQRGAPGPQGVKHPGERPQWPLTGKLGGCCCLQGAKLAGLSRAAAPQLPGWPEKGNSWSALGNFHHPTTFTDPRWKNPMF